MKQRYHYNVANTRVEQHVEKGNQDGLYISSVACCHELWGLIMDAGTGFQQQVSLLLAIIFMIAIMLSRILHLYSVLWSCLKREIWAELRLSGKECVYKFCAQYLPLTT